MGKGNGNAGLYSCHKQGGSQAWMFTREGRIRSDDACLSWTRGERSGKIKKPRCVSRDFSTVDQQKWLFSKEV